MKVAYVFFNVIFIFYVILSAGTIIYNIKKKHKKYTKKELLRSLFEMLLMISTYVVAIYTIQNNLA